MEQECFNYILVKSRQRQPGDGTGGREINPTENETLILDKVVIIDGRLEKT